MIDHAELAVLGALAAARVGLSEGELARVFAASGSGVDADVAVAAVLAKGLCTRRGAVIEITRAGIERFLALQGEIEAALRPGTECPSLPWITRVQTQWIDALSLNYAVREGALEALLPTPLEPEVFRGSGWVQVLISSLRDLRPQGLGALFGVCFYQVSYRAAVRHRRPDGSWHRGGYFVRSDTNHPVMRAVGNALAEFRFHDFGAAEVVMLREGDRLTVGVDPEPGSEGGKVFGIFPTTPLAGPPPTSVWRSYDELVEPLVECYDALGVDGEQGYLYTLTIDRDPWEAWFIEPEELYCEYFDTGPLGGAGRLDSVLHFRECGYRWRPLRREPISPTRS